MACNCNEEESRFSAAEALKSVTSAVKSIVKSVVKETYDPFVSREIQAERLKICEGCENYHLSLKKPRCKVCGCFLKYKTSLRDQSCPHPDGAKWPQTE